MLSLHQGKHPNALPASGRCPGQPKGAWFRKFISSQYAQFAFGHGAAAQLTSAKKYWSDGTVVAGQHFEYGYDDIGNRKFAASGGNEWGTGLREERYTVNNLNQYSQRTVPPKAGVIGSATNTAIVTVNNQPTWRKAEYYAGDVPVDNGASPVWQSITNLGVLNNGTNSDTVTNITGNLLVPKTPESFTYDADGNLITDGLWTNTWNGENRLIATESLSSVPSAGRAKQTWAYMPDGRWLERIVYTWNGSTYVPQSTNRFAWDGNILLAILDHTNGVALSSMRGLDLSGSPQGAGGAGGLLATTMTGNGTHFAAFDGNGNVAGLVNAADGKLSAIYEYAPFGSTLRETGSAAKQNPIRFSTQFADDLTRDVKYKHREFDGRGKWKSRDPIEELGGPNISGYPWNDSINRIDMFGLGQPLPVPTPPPWTPVVIEGGAQVVGGLTAGQVAGIGGAIIIAVPGAYFMWMYVNPPPSPVFYPNPGFYGNNAPPQVITFSPNGTPVAIPRPPLLPPTPFVPFYPDLPNIPFTPSNQASGTHPNSPLPAGSTDPVSLHRVNPGRDGCGNCKPCPPNSPAWEVNEPGHGSTTTHWHWIEYHQRKSDCECFPKRMSSPTKPNGA